MSLKIKKGDKIVVISGKDKGKTGKILRISTKNNRAVVEGINLVKKHFRRRSESEPGGIKEIPIAIHESNIMLFCPNCSKGIRFEIKRMDKKTKIRICKKCSNPI